jgi:receptor protein-tyrosine kinase
VVDQARPPARPFTPSLPIYASIGGFSGLFVGLLWAGYTDRRDSNVVVPGMLPEFARIRELGIIPSATIDRDIREYAAPFLFRSQNTLRPMLPTTSSSVFSESFYAAVASILRAECNGIQPRVLTVTSAVPGDGKTTVTTNLGLALANIQFRVVLIEGDLRHPRLSNSFKIANSWGLSDVLQYTNSYDDMPLEALAKRTETPGLFVLPSGPSVVSVSSLLHSPRWSALLEALRRQADLILIDSPPLLAVSDARILGSISDAVILVVRAHKTARATFRMATQQLIDDRTPILGTIINAWSRRRAHGTKDPFQYQYPFRYQYTYRD